MIEFRNSILSAGLFFVLLAGILWAFQYDIDRALITAAFAAVPFGTFMYFFVTSKAFKRQTQIENADEASVIYSGNANHFLNGEAVGGKLYLLADKLQFQSHSLNIQNHRLIMEIRQIKEVSFYNTLGVVPNGLAITMMSGEHEKFVVNGKRNWKKEIEKRMGEMK